MNGFPRRGSDTAATCNPSKLQVRVPVAGDGYQYPISNSMHRMQVVELMLVKTVIRFHTEGPEAGELRRPVSTMSRPMPECSAERPRSMVMAPASTA